MSLRTAVLIVLLLSVSYALTFSPQIIQTLDEIVAYVANAPALIAYMGMSVMLLLLGHAVRAYRDTVLFSKAVRTTARMQFLAFAVGSLCNSVLPLRIGEFMRADIIAQKYGTSFSFSFVLICIERLVDVLILGILACALIGFNMPLAIIGVVLFMFVIILWKSPKAMRKALSSFGKMLNSRVEAKFLFTFWSMEYGLKRTLRTRLMTKYCALSVLNWALYIVSLFPAIAFMYSADDMLRMSVGVFVALTTSLAPSALGDYTPTISGFGFDASPELILLWMIAVVPTAFIGFILALFNLRHLPLLRRRGEQDGKADLDNKLSRNTDISSEQLGFMKDYYGGKPLARKIALEEMAGGSAFAKYFTAGGSGAMTYQSKLNGEACVVKLVSRANADALRAQYEWLKSHTSPNIVRILGEEEDGTTYSIAIEYEDSAIGFFEYFHMISIAEGRRLLDEVVESLDKSVWSSNEKPLSHPDDAEGRVSEYLENHIEKPLAIASKYVPEIDEARKCARVIVNGVEYPNLDEMLERIGEEDIFKSLIDFRISDAIHGDLICDNLIYSATKERLIVLDPSDSRNNCFDGPVFDFGKLSQSLQIGYEFLLRDDSAVDVEISGGVCSINYPDNRSAAYEALWQHVSEVLAPRYLTESERRTMLFLGATNYFRRMKHQAVQCPQNTMKFYAVGIRFLEEYIDQFGRDENE